MKAANVDQRMIDVGADYVTSREKVLVHRPRIAGHTTVLVAGRYWRARAVEHLLIVGYARIAGLLWHAGLHVVLEAAERTVRGQVEQQNAVRRQLFEAARQKDEQLMYGRFVKQVPGEECESEF